MVLNYECLIFTILSIKFYAEMDLFSVLWESDFFIQQYLEWIKNVNHLYVLFKENTQVNDLNSWNEVRNCHAVLLPNFSFI